MFVLSVLGCSIVLTAVTATEVKPAEDLIQPAAAKITPDGLVVFRFKREPQIPREPLQKMNRAMTFTGFMPNGGMTAFSAAADSYQPRPSWYSKPTGPADTLTPPMESDQPAQPEQEEPMWAKKPKKKPYHPSKYYPSQTTQDEDEEEYEAPSRRGGSATASFNAWFPILFGNFPGNGQFGRNGGQEGSKQGGQDSNYPNSRSSEYPGQTVIANSVSNGRGGVASSHAVAYGYRPEGRNYGNTEVEMAPKTMQPSQQHQSYY
ncbi:hypothetical protein M8J76_013758 [Diaphorina citri]|nr:hypothetical protein M8J75_015537 [Diaphorina citri]KAI5750205.1 hypothetical protein M8J76_013758 [Diaphorina citri]